MRLAISLLLLAAVLAGCSDDATQPEPEPAPVVWQRMDLSRARENEPTLELQAIDDNLFVVAEGFFTYIDAERKVGETYLNHWQKWFDMPFVNRDYYAYPVDSYDGRRQNFVLGVRRSAAPHREAILTYISLAQLDPTLAVTARYEGENRAVAAITDDGRMLVPVNNFQLELPGAPYLYLVRLSIANEIEIEFEVEKRIDWSPYGPLAPSVLTVGGRFYASSNETYEVHADGSITKVLDTRLRSIIEHDGRLIAGTWSGVYSSSNDGATWERVSSVEPDKFFVVDGRLCFLPGPNLINVDTGEVTALAYDGLPYLPLRAATQVGNRVYVATRNGLYFKPAGNFFDLSSREIIRLMRVELTTPCSHSPRGRVKIVSRSRT